MDFTKLFNKYRSSVPLYSYYFNCSINLFSLFYFYYYLCTFEFMDCPLSTDVFECFIYLSEICFISYHIEFVFIDLLPPVSSCKVIPQSIDFFQR